MESTLETLITGPTLPGTFLLGVCLLYWAFMIFGALCGFALDFGDHVLHLGDFFHFGDHGHLGDHGPLDLDGHHVGWGGTVLTFLNFDDVPLFLWLTAFAGSYTASSVWLDGSATYDGQTGAYIAAIARSATIALVVTKLLTQPLRGKFKLTEPNQAATLIGRECIVQTSEVTERFGQGRFDTEAAPLYLNIRSASAAYRFERGQPARIIAYDEARHCFIVEPVPSSGTMNDQPATASVSEAPRSAQPTTEEPASSVADSPTLPVRENI